MRREQKETFRQPVNKPVRDFDAAALGRCVVPNFIEFDFGLWGETVRHHVFGALVAARRVRPRCFTSAAKAMSMNKGIN